jgi:hypothetical protein
MPLLLAQNSTLYGIIGVAGVAVIILYSLGLAFLSLWTDSEMDADELFPGVFGAWIFGVAAILYVTTTIQRIL